MFSERQLTETLRSTGKRAFKVEKSAANVGQSREESLRRNCWILKSERKFFEALSTRIMLQLMMNSQKIQGQRFSVKFSLSRRWTARLALSNEDWGITKNFLSKFHVIKLMLIQLWTTSKLSSIPRNVWARHADINRRVLTHWQFSTQIRLQVMIFWVLKASVELINKLTTCRANFELSCKPQPCKHFRLTFIEKLSSFLFPWTSIDRLGMFSSFSQSVCTKNLPARPKIISIIIKWGARKKNPERSEELNDSSLIFFAQFHQVSLSNRFGCCFASIGNWNFCFH